MLGKPKSAKSAYCAHGKSARDLKERRTVETNAAITGPETNAAITVNTNAGSTVRTNGSSAVRPSYAFVLGDSLCNDNPVSDHFNSQGYSVHGSDHLDAEVEDPLDVLADVAGQIAAQDKKADEKAAAEKAAAEKAAAEKAAAEARAVAIRDALELAEREAVERLQRARMNEEMLLANNLTNNPTNNLTNADITGGDDDPNAWLDMWMARMAEPEESLQTRPSPNSGNVASQTVPLVSTVVVERSVTFTTTRTTTTLGFFIGDIWHPMPQ